MARNIDDFWKILAEIKGESNDLTEAVKAIAKNEQTISERLFGNIIDQVAFNSQDYQRLRSFLRDWYAAHRTLTSFQANISDVYQMPNDQLDDLFQSFGYDLSSTLKNPTNNEAPLNKVNFFLDLVNLYKIKGTPQAIVDVLQYYGIAEVDLYELSLQFDERARKNPDDLIFKGKIIAGTSTDISNIYLPFDLLTLGDPHWLQSESQIKTLFQQNKINFPSQSPYFAIKPLFDEEATDAATGILSRQVQNQHDEWISGGGDPEDTTPILPQDAIITITGDQCSLLTLYLSTIYTFNKEWNVGAFAPNFICYDGINVDAIDIMNEFRDVTKKVNTRLEWKTQWNKYLDLFTRSIGSNFLQVHTSAKDTLEILNPTVKANLDNLSASNVTVLGTLLTDLGDWVRNNISFGFINMSYILFGIDSLFGQLTKVIDFFKPYRTRLVPLELIQIRNRLFNSIIVEDSFTTDIKEDVHDFLTGDSEPCCPDSTTCLHYSRDTYDCGSWHDIGAVTDLPQDLFIELQDNIHDAMRCPQGDTTAGFVVSEVLTISAIENVHIDTNSLEVSFQVYEKDTLYPLTINLFNEIDTTSFYSFIVTSKTVSGFSVLFSGKMDTDNYYISYETERSDNFGTESLSNGNTTKIVNFAVPEVNNNYSISLGMSNLSDANPTTYHYSIIEKTVNGFTVQFSTPIASNNYMLDWRITRLNSDLEVMSAGMNVVTIILPTAQVNDNYGIGLSLINTVDSTSTIIPFIVTNKTITDFDVSFNQPLDSNNFVLSWNLPFASSLNVEEFEYYQTGGFRDFDGLYNPTPSDSTGNINVSIPGTEGSFDCTHGFDLVQIEIEDVSRFILQENGFYLLQENSGRILL